MEILTYYEVDDQQMSELTLACFSHAYSREHVKKMVAADSRLPDWGGELYACENGKVLGTVGLLYPKLKTSEGVIKVGGIRNVCTRPSTSRKGTARKLMEEAHRRMVEEGVRYSLLMTSRSLIAYDLYLKLGYKDVHIYPTAFKKVEKKDAKVEFREEVDPMYVKELYRQSVSDLEGLTVREDDYWQMAEARGWPSNDNVEFAYLGDEKVGYAMYHKRRKQVDCGEIAAKDENSLRDILESLEATVDREFIVIYYVNPDHHKLLDQMGYTINNDNWGRVMMKDIGDENSLEFDHKFHVGCYETY